MRSTIAVCALCLSLLLSTACAEIPLPGDTALTPAATLAATAVDGPQVVAPPTDTPAPDSGLEGLVTMGPACPVMQVDTPCPNSPYSAVLVIVDAAGQTVAQVQSDSQGYFKIGLPAGSYTLQPQGNRVQTAPPQEVTITPGEYLSVTVLYDSGIR